MVGSLSKRLLSKANMSVAPPRGFLLAMPVLIINLGMEMVYVLEQRLRAQQIPPEKGRRGACAWAARPFPRPTSHVLTRALAPPQCSLT
jgi:hypothetical protein